MSSPQTAKYWQDRNPDDPKRDWGYDGSWIEGYVHSKSHPHRQLVIDALYKLGASSVLELGCSTGPNLMRIREQMSIADKFLAGTDVNYDALKVASAIMPDVEFRIGSATNIPFSEKYDVVLADAVLMYVPPKEIARALKEMARLARKGIVIVDWYARFESIKDFHFARNYPRLLRDLGFKVEMWRFTWNTWPTDKWIKNGRVFVARLPSPISKPSSRPVRVYTTGTGDEIEMVE